MQLDENLSYQEQSVVILDRQVRNLRSMEVPLVKYYGITKLAVVVNFRPLLGLQHVSFFTPSAKLLFCQQAQHEPEKKASSLPQGLTQATTIQNYPSGSSS